MPNRIIKESVRCSYEIDQLSPQAESTFYRLITLADDYGRFQGDPKLLQSALFPLRPTIRGNDFARWIAELQSAGLVRLYVGTDGKPYGLFKTWEKHQQQRAKRSRWPEPRDEQMFGTLGELIDAVNGTNVQADDSTCKQMIADDSICSSHARNPNPNPNPNPKEKPSCPNSVAFGLAEKLSGLIVQNNPKAKIPKKIDSWAEVIDKMTRIDGHEPFEIEKVIVWCQADNFWMSNILSAEKLREKFAQLWGKMNNGKPKHGGKAHEFSGKEYIGTPPDQIAWLKD